MAVLRPERIFPRTSDIDVQADVCALGFTCVLLDIDHTLRARDIKTVPDDVRAWLEELKAAGISLCLLSNNWHADTQDFADELGIPLVAKAMKPLPFGCFAALKKVGAQRGRTLMVGDQLSTDVWAAHLAGLTAYLVEPLCTTDLAHTRVVRKVESFILGQRA